jgi:chromosome segregation ATPase
MSNTTYAAIGTPDLTAGLNARTQIGQLVRGLVAAEKVLDVLQASQGVANELDAAITKKREELAKLESATMDEAKAAAKAEGEKMIAEAKKKADGFLADAIRRHDEAEAAVKKAQDEVAALQAKVTELKKQAAKLAS